MLVAKQCDTFISTFSQVVNMCNIVALSFLKGHELVYKLTYVWKNHHYVDVVQVHMSAVLVLL